MDTGKLRFLGTLACCLLLISGSLTAGDDLPDLVTKSKELRVEISKGVDAVEVERADALLNQLATQVRLNPSESCPEMRSLVAAVFSAKMKENAAHPAATWDGSLRLLRRMSQEQLWADAKAAADKEKSDQEQKAFYGNIAAWVLALRKQNDGEPIENVPPPKVPASYKNGFKATPDPSEIPDEKERAEYAKELKLYHSRVNANVKRKALPHTIERAEELLARELLSSPNATLRSAGVYAEIMQASGASEERIRNLRRDHAAQH